MKIAKVLVLTLIVGAGGAYLTARSCVSSTDDVHSQRAFDAANFARMCAVMLHSGDIDAALAAGRTAIELDPRNVDARVNLGDALAATKSWRDALESYSAAMRLAPDNFSAHRGAANALSALDDMPGAERELRECVRLAPDDAEARMNLASNLAVQRRFAEALDEMRRAHELGRQRADWPYPTQQWIDEFQHELDEQRSSPHGDALH